MIGNLYPSWLYAMASGSVGYPGTPLVGILVTSAYSYDPSHVIVADIAPEVVEVVGGSYVRAALTGLSIAQNNTVTAVTWNPITFPLITATADNAPRGLIIAMEGPPETARLVLYQDFEAAVDANGEDLTVTPNASGLITYTPV